MPSCSHGSLSTNDPRGFDVITLLPIGSLECMLRLELKLPATELLTPVVLPPLILPLLVLLAPGTLREVERSRHGAWCSEG